MARSERSTLLVTLGLVATVALGAACGERGALPAGAGGGGTDPAPGAETGAALPHDLDVPVGLPVQLDGAMPDAEWADALRRPLGGAGAALHVKQVRGTLLLGVDAPHAWPTRSGLWFLFAPDEEGSGLYTPPAVRLDLDPVAHNRSHLLPLRVVEGGREQLAAGLAVARSRLTGQGASVEVAVRLSLLGVDARASPPVRFAVLWTRAGGSGPVTWPAGLGTGGPPGEPPPDLARSDGWGRLRGWVDPGGPGAFPQTRWDAFVEEDREMARRGRDAHAFGILLSDASELPKVDREQVPAVVENLRWIAAREPLTPDDLLLLAQAYRFWNRPAEALATLDALDAHADWRGSDRVRYERALTLESDQRYDEAARVWTALGERGDGGRYVPMADRAHVRLALWTEEREARRQDDARDDLPLVLLRTSRGNVVVLLHRDDVPASVDHFLSLVARREGDRGFYDGTLFHRVIGDYLVQGGDPASRDESCDAAGPGDGPVTLPVEENARHGFWRGAVGFARGPERYNGCQFFVLVSPRPELGDQEFTCFGHVVAGMDVVDRLERCDVLLEARVIRGREAADSAPEGAR